jgi:peptide/nickel transport system substrate-binding protein
MTRRRWASGIALVALTVTACGMGGGDDTDNNGDSGDGEGSGNGHIVYDEPFAPAAAWATETDDAFTLSRAGCLETLTKYQPDGTLTENLATAWEQVEPKTWEFTLQDGVTFQDGTPMDADAVAGALTHVLEAKVPARSFNPDVVSAVKAVDDSTVDITTPKPDVLLPLRMASPNTGILAPKAYEGKRIDIKGTCTGPFTVVEEAARESLTLERNENYWGGDVGAATAEVRFVVDGATRATQVQTGEAQIAGVIPAVSVATLEGDANVEVVSLPIPRTSVLLLNNSRPPFDDPLVRQAVQHAIDVTTIAETVYEGGAIPAIGPFSPEDPWAPEGAEPATFDQDEAQSLLDQAGVDPSSLNFELIAYNDRPEFGDLAAVIQDELGQLGATVKIKAGEYASFEPDLLAGEFDAALLSRGYLVDLGDPLGYLTSDYTCDGGYNIAHYCDPEVDAMVSEAAGLEDAEARHAIYAQIAEKLQGDPASVFLVHESLVTATTADLEGFEPHPLNLYVLTKDLSVG